ncbi:MAG: hypothetical protein U0325_31820 [Polyangiales bacterium]
MRQSSSPSRPRPSFLALVLVAGLQAFCKRAQSVGQQCVFNSDCDQEAHLVCAGRVCRPQCNLTVMAVNGRHPDCPAANTYCGPTGQTGVGACLDNADPGYLRLHDDCSPTCAASTGAARRSAAATVTASRSRSTPRPPAAWSTTWARARSATRACASTRRS